MSLAFFFSSYCLQKDPRGSLPHRLPAQYFSTLTAEPFTAKAPLYRISGSFSLTTAARSVSFPLPPPPDPRSGALGRGTAALSRQPSAAARRRRVLLRGGGRLPVPPAGAGARARGGCREDGDHAGGALAAGLLDRGAALEPLPAAGRVARQRAGRGGTRGHGLQGEQEEGAGQP